MRILLVTHYFPPEVGAPQARLSELAAAWAESGQAVTVLTGIPNHPTGVVPAEYRGVRCRVESGRGYRIVRTWLYATPNEGILKKTIGHVSFMITSVLLGAARTGPVDVVVVSSPTFFSIGAGWVLAKLRRAKFVVEVRDLWPALFVELGVLTNRQVIRVLEKLELAAYSAADAVVVVSEGFKQNLLARGVPDRKVHTIRNGVDLDRFASSTEAESSRLREAGIADDEVVVLYIGAHGISQGLTSVAEAAALLTDLAVRVVLIGEGADKERVRARVADLGVQNVVMLPAVPRDEVPKLLARADVCLAPLRDVPLFSTFIPSKIFEYLAAGRAVVGSVTGEAAQILHEAGAVVVAPEHPEQLAAAIRELVMDPDLRRTMGSRGQAYVRANFDRRMLAHRYLEILEGLPA
ncbi:MAG TPA: glycosyltransferase family 4 protein [Mycobacteriales bacterium]|nr:glycosyltransferase family 4 protein [Mycobacteriales bacterium]